METFTIVLLYILAIYGIIQIGIDIISAYMYSKAKSDGINLCVFVKNKEDRVEYFLRSLVFNIIKNTSDAGISKIYVCDVGSTDRTLEIVERLKNENEYIEILDKNRIADVFDNNDD